MIKLPLIIPEVLFTEGDVTFILDDSKLSPMLAKPFEFWLIESFTSFKPASWFNDLNVNDELIKVDPL